jgi:hypothetical protein
MLNAESLHGVTTRKRDMVSLVSTFRTPMCSCHNRIGQVRLGWVSEVHVGCWVSTRRHNQKTWHGFFSFYLSYTDTAIVVLATYHKLIVGANFDARRHRLCIALSFEFSIQLWNIFEKAFLDYKVSASVTASMFSVLHSSTPPTHVLE